MSDPDRRFEREGGEPPLTMDSQGRRRARGPAPVALIVSLLLLGVVGAGVFYMYRSGVKGPGDAPQPLGTPLGDIRAPAPAAQSSDAAAGLSISKDEPNAAPIQPTLAAPPEEPAAESGGRPPAAAQPAPAAAIPAPPPPPNDAAVSAPPPRRAAPVRAESKPETIDNLIARSQTPPAERPKPVPKTKTEPDSKDSGGPSVIQIGAFSSQRLADEEWSKAAAIAPGVMAGKGKRVVPVAKDGATLYRTSITGFSSRDEAVALCGRLRAAGGHCFVH